MKHFKYLSLLLISFFLFKHNVSAGSLAIWANATNVTLGSSVTISVNANNLAGTFNVSSSNNSILSGGVSGEWLDNNTYTFKFTAKSVGKVTVTASSVDVADYDTNSSFSGSKGVTLNVVEKKSSTSGGTISEKKEYSSDNNLSSLSIEGYEFNPGFDKDTTEYRLAVDESVEKINVIAKANHEKASVTGQGEVQLSSGENTIEVKVTAENGNEKIYKLIVIVEDQNPISVNVGKDKYTIVKKNNNLIEKLDYYEEKTIKIDDVDVVAYENSKTKVTLVILKNTDGKLSYYIYNEKTGEYSKYRYITFGNITLQLLDAPSALENYKKSSVTINEEKITYYKLKKAYKVGLIYGTNIKTGNTGYYVYDKNEETLSKYYDEEVKLYKNKLREEKNLLMILMGVVAFIGIILIVLSIKGNKKRKKLKV